MNSNIYLKRQTALKTLLAERGLDGMLITNLTNIRYLSGFTGSSATCIVLPDKQYFISDGRYDQQSKQEVKGFQRIIGSESHVEIMSARKQNLIPGGVKLGYEGDHLTVTRFNELREQFPKVTWENCPGILEDLQSVKDSSEIDAIRTAVEITDAVFEEILPLLKAGVTEKTVANRLALRYRELGDGEAYTPIVAGGPNSALPHAVPTDRTFQSGDFIVIDAAAKYAGYHADMTRTPVIGPATDKHREIYELVKGAQQACLDQARAGVACKDLDSAARDFITAGGYGDYFNHGTGHGLGLNIHTQPRLSQLSRQILAENNVVTVEPGIYLPEWGGVRIEDDIVVQADGCEILNQTPRELLEL
ncbi:MAG: M24 family metallopeptidase [Fidelibacterota bacterium]